MNTTIRSFLLAAALTCTGAARADTLDQGLASVQHAWATAYYNLPVKQKSRALEALAGEAQTLAQQNPGRAEPLVWQAIVLSSQAKFDGGLGALGLIKQARGLLLEAEKIDARTLDGSVYTSLGSLYAKSPGWPIAFGDKKKARDYLEKALVLNPDGIDPNFFYGELLLEQKDRAGARKYLEKALAAPPRPGREDADAGRRAEIRAVLAELQS